jgi:hypothetical protein
VVGAAVILVGAVVVVVSIATDRRERFWENRLELDRKSALGGRLGAQLLGR